MARYDLGETAALQLNVDNVFDKTYYSSFWTQGTATSSDRSAARR